MQHAWLALVMVGCSCALAACPRLQNDSLSASEAQMVLEEVSVSSQAETLVADSVEISTHFTVGDAARKAADDLRVFIESQLPCAAVTVVDTTLTIEYGRNPGACTFHGNTFDGTHKITIMRNDTEVFVQHEWIRFSNGKVSVSGTADVTWSLKDESRHVVHEIMWDSLVGPHAGRRVFEATGDRTQTPLKGGIAEGISIDGSRAWDSNRGHFELDVDHVEVRWVDSVPQAGAYTLLAPSGRTLEFSFSRVDDDTIAVTVDSGSRSFSFNVSKLGQVVQK